MRTKRIIEGVAFGPDVLNVLRQAFDEAGSAVADNFKPHEHENAREILAHSIMRMTRDDTNDGAILKQAGTRAMRLAYPSRFASASGQNGTDG